MRPEEYTCRILKHIFRCVLALLVFCPISVAQEAVPSPEQQVKQVTKAFFQSVNDRNATPIEPSVIGARDYFSGYPKDNPGGTIRNLRVLKTTIEGENKAHISGRLWVVPDNGKAGKTFTFEHGLMKKNSIWITETLLYNYISTK